jgi:glutathione S-transferase
MYVLHYAPDNASLIVRLALAELGQPCRCVLVDRAVHEQDGAAYRALNPLGLIPVLETPAGPLFETAAILLWLSETHGGLAPAPGTAERGHFLKWLFYLSNTVHAELRTLFYPERAVPRVMVPALHRQLSGRIAGHFDQLDRLAAAGGPGGFSATGDDAGPNLVDLYTVVLMRWSVLYPYDGARWFDPARYPALRALARRLEGRPAVRAVTEAEGLGPAPFSAPRYPAPKEGSAT